jgi:hypothetical protein
LAEEVDELKRAAKARQLVLADETEGGSYTTTTRKTKRTTTKTTVTTTTSTKPETNWLGIALLNVIVVSVAAYVVSKRK